MTDDAIPTGLKELEAQFLLQIDKIRDDVVGLLADALQACPEDQRARHCNRAFQVNDSLEAMHTILWRMVDLVDRAKGDAGPGLGGDRRGSPGG